MRHGAGFMGGFFPAMLSKPIPLWIVAGGMALAAIAGCINAVGFVGAHHLALTHMSGTVTNLGGEVALGQYEVARHTVVPPYRDGGQAQYIQRPLPQPQQAGTAAARAWALGRLHEPIQLRDMAERESMSVRTFTRRFREEAGISPGQWLTRQRVERARYLLESSDLSIDRIARDAGFGTAQSMRQHLQTVLGVTPTAYRRTFRTGGADGADTAA